jgi:hypothetical protein
MVTPLLPRNGLSKTLPATVERLTSASIFRVLRVGAPAAVVPPS